MRELQEFLKILNIPVFVEENGEWKPYNRVAKYFCCNSDYEKISIDDKKFCFLNVDILHIKGLFHDIRILLQRLKNGSNEALVDLVQIVEDFLSYSTPALVFDDVNLCETLQSVVRLYSWSKIDVDCKEYMIRADVQYLYRVILNIIDNLNRHSTKTARIFIEDDFVVFEGSGDFDREGEGLRIIKDLMNKMGGSVEFKAESGKIKYILRFPKEGKHDTI